MSDRMKRVERQNFNHKNVKMCRKIVRLHEIVILNVCVRSISCTFPIHSTRIWQKLSDNAQVIVLLLLQSLWTKTFPNPFTKMNLQHWRLHITKCIIPNNYDICPFSNNSKLMQVKERSSYLKPKFMWFNM